MVAHWFPAERGDGQVVSSATDVFETHPVKMK